MKTILLAEDEQTVRTVVDLLLTSSGYNVITSDDGLDALKKAREYKGEIHCVLADIVMPRMTGIELAMQLSVDRPKARVLLVSALSTRAVELQQGWQFLQKPFKLSVLKDKIRALLQDESDIDLEGPNTQSAQVASGSGCESAVGGRLQHRTFTCARGWQ